MGEAQYTFDQLYITPLTHRRLQLQRSGERDMYKIVG